MGSTLNKAVARLVDQGEFDEAVALADAATRKPDAPADDWAVLSHTLEISGNVEDALDAARKALELAPGEPSYWHQYGWLAFLVDDNRAALGAMQKTLELGQQLQNGYYAESAAFLAAESLRRLGRHREALVMADLVRDDFTLHAGGVLTKGGLVTACERAIAHAGRQIAA